jgi:uncharacterized protein (TIGR02996 family)
MTSDEEFIRAILAHPEDAALRLVYADWLEEHGDPRAEFLRLEDVLAEAVDKDAEYWRVWARAKELRSTLDAQWLALFERLPMENCGVHFRFQCPQRWEKLQRTDETCVRFCSACGQDVFYCDDIHEARAHAREGHCVAIDSRLPREHGDLNLNPEPGTRYVMTLGMLDDDIGEDERAQARRPWWRFW